MTTQEPAEVFSLAEILADEMTARGWTTSDVARRMPGRRDYVHNKLALDVLMVVSPSRETLKVDDEDFDNLSAAFGISADFFRNIHAAWMRWPDRRSPFECPEELFGTDVQLCMND